MRVRLVAFSVQRFRSCACSGARRSFPELTLITARQRRRDELTFLSFVDTRGYDHAY